MFDPTQKQRALDFAHALSRRDYASAYALCSNKLKSQITAEKLQEDFEDMIPLDWGAIDPIELMENEAFPFLYVVLGGDVYSEAIIIDAFATEDGVEKIDNFEFGRP